MLIMLGGPNQGRRLFNTGNSISGNHTNFNWASGLEARKVVDKTCGAFLNLKTVDGVRNLSLHTRVRGEELWGDLMRT